MSTRPEGIRGGQLTCLTLPKDHRTRLPSTTPLERLDKEITRRTHVVGIFPNQNAIVRLVGALMLEQNDECAVTRRYKTLETIDEVCKHRTVDVVEIATVQPDRLGSALIPRGAAHGFTKTHPVRRGRTRRTRSPSIEL